MFVLTRVRNHTSAQRSCAAKPSRPQGTCRNTCGPTQVSAHSGALLRAVAAPSPHQISARYMCAPTQASGPTPAPSPTVVVASPAPPTTRIMCASIQVGQLVCEEPLPRPHLPLLWASDRGPLSSSLLCQPATPGWAGVGTPNAVSPTMSSAPLVAGSSPTVLFASVE